MITLSIDVTLLDKARFKTITRKNGQQAKFCDLVIFQSKAGELFVKQQVTKEERLAKVEMPILGNAKDWDNQSQSRPASPASAPASETDDNSQVPF